MHGWHVIDARHDLDALGKRPVGDRVGDDIGGIAAAHGEEITVAVESDLGLYREIARLVVADKRLAALAGPFDRPADAPRCPGDERKFRVEAAARAEIAADLLHDDPHLVFRYAEDFGEVLLRADRAAHAGIERIATALGLIGADRRARLHRHADNTRDPGREFHDMRGRGE